MSKSIFTALAALALFASALSPHAEPLSERKTLTLEGAEKVMALRSPKPAVSTHRAARLPSSTMAAMPC